MPEQLAAMSTNIEKLNSKIERAVADGQLMEPAAKNVRTLLDEAPSDLYLRAVEELVDRVSPEVSRTGKHAKDLGSFAVFCTIAAAVIYIAYVVIF